MHTCFICTEMSIARLDCHIMISFHLPTCWHQKNLDGPTQGHPNKCTKPTPLFSQRHIKRISSFKITIPFNTLACWIVWSFFTWNPNVESVTSWKTHEINVPPFFSMPGQPGISCHMSQPGPVRPKLRGCLWRWLAGHFLRLGERRRLMADFHKKHVGQWSIQWLGVFRY